MPSSFPIYVRGNRVVQIDVSTCERTIGAQEQSNIYLYIIWALHWLITLWNGPENRRCMSALWDQVSTSRSHSVIMPKPAKNKQYGSSTQMPYWQSLFFQPLGTQTFGKVSWWMKHLAWNRVCPSEGNLLRYPSRRLLRAGYPLLPPIDQMAF